MAHFFKKKIFLTFCPIEIFTFYLFFCSQWYIVNFKCDQMIEKSCPIFLPKLPNMWPNHFYMKVVLFKIGQKITRKFATKKL